MKHIFLFSCIIVLLSYKTSSNRKYISITEMAEIISEMELAQASFKILPDDHKFDVNFMFDEIYKKHQITEDEFNENLKFYSSKPKDMDEIYNRAISIISEKQIGLIVKQ